MMPMVNTATMILASEADEPFWNSSQTNLPRPGFCASISAAISTIQPTPSDSRRPVKISGSDDGSTILTTLVYQGSRSTRPTLIRSLSIEATPMAVLISVGHSEHKVTVIADTKNDFGNSGSCGHIERADDHGHQRQPGQRRYRLEDLHQRVDRSVEGFRQAAHHAERHRENRAEQEAGEHRLQAGDDLVEESRRAGIRPHLDLGLRIFRQQLRVALVLALVEGALLGAFGKMARPTDCRPAARPAPVPARCRDWF